MAYEFLASVDPANLNSSELLHHLDGKIRASRAIEAGGPDGLIRTLDFSPEGENPDGISSYSPGEDHPHDLAIPETFANEKPLAKKNMGTEDPRKLHVLAEWDSRYDGTTGINSLRTLSRMAVAMSAITAQKASVQMQTVVVNSDKQPLILDEQPFDAVWSMARVDEYLAAEPDVTGQPDPLTEGLFYLAESGYGPHADADACIVVSDFLSGAERDKNGKLLGFSWEEPLSYLNHELGDRLFVAQLTSPAQTRLPSVRTLRTIHKTVELDTDEFLTANVRYTQLALEKAERITHTLRGIRQLQLSSVSETPFIDLSDFMFGKPTNS